MTRLEVDIDTEKRGERTVISTNLRVVRECSPPRDNAKLEAKLAHAIRMAVVQLLKKAKPKTKNMKPTHIITVKQLLHHRGFFRPTTDPLGTASILRGEKTAVILNGSCHVNKGDYLAFQPVKPPLDMKDCFSKLNNIVFEVTFVSPVPNSNPIQQLVCFRKVSNYIFKEGDTCGEFKEDSLVKVETVGVR